ncbi:MAG: hypothetical protein WC133_02050 [Candidatus Omnitrophota bacterium]
MKRAFFLSGLFVLLFSGLCLAAEKADDIHVKAEVDKAFLTIGDPVTYTVTVEHAPDIRILSEIPAPSSEILEIKKIEDIHKAQKKKVVTGRKFILTTYRLGEFILDPVTLRYQKDGGPEKSIQTNKLYLTVKSVAGGEPQEDIRDVKTVVPYKMRVGKFLGTLLALALLTAGYFLYRALRKKKNGLQPAPPPLSPEEEALLHLGELFESDLLKRGLIKVYYLRLSEILRVYFEKRYQILAVELTTVEILRALKPLHLEAGLYQKIQYVLEASDLAKFAKWIPTAPEILQINKKSEEIIKESVPVLEQALAEAHHGV